MALVRFVDRFRRFLPFTIAALLLLGFAPVSHTVSARAETKIVAVSGWSQLGDTPIGVEVLLAEPAGSDTATLEAQALAAANASQTPPSGAFSVTGAVWDQFFDHRRQNNVVVQSYNPVGDPTQGAGFAALSDAQRTWSSVDGSTFRYSFGGVTTRCPSLVPFCSAGSTLDGQNDVGWVDIPIPFVLGITITAFNRVDGTILESDLALNRSPLLPWSTDGTSIDVQTAMTHENGHAAGLGHSPDPSAVMYAFLALGEIRRTLTIDDTDGLRFLYPTKPHTLVSTNSAYGFRIADELGAANDRMNDYEPGSFDRSGAAAFVADVPQGEGVFVSSLSGTHEIVRSGDTVDGLTLGVTEVDRIGSNDSGDVVFAFQVAPLTPLFGFGAALFEYHAADASVSALVRPGVTPAPGGGVFLGARGARISNLGETVFGGLVDTPSGPAFGVFAIGADRVIRAIARPGQALPGGTAAFAMAPTVNNRGDVAFEAFLVGDRGDSLFFWHADSGTVDVVVRSGDAAGGVTIRSARLPELNSVGDVLFRGDLSIPRRASGLFLHSKGATAAVALPGDPMPDGSGLVTLTRGFISSYALSDGGEVTFLARTTFLAGGGSAVYRRSHRGLDLVARTGTIVPGVGELTFLASALTNPRGDVLLWVGTSGGRMLLLVANPQA